jgi:hypothetical protein
MSYYGDRTAQQEILDSVEYVQVNYELTRDELIIVMLSVISAIADPCESTLNEVRKMKPRN